MAQANENGEPSIAGNALAGAYLANLGYSYKVIAALINVGPKEMNWLSFEWAKALGIKVIRGGPLQRCNNKRNRPLRRQSIPIHRMRQARSVRFTVIAVLAGAIALVAGVLVVRADTPAEEHTHCQRYAKPGSKTYLECRLRLQQLQQCFDATNIKWGSRLYENDQIFQEEDVCVESVYRRYPQPMKGN